MSGDHTEEIDAEEIFQENIDYVRAHISTLKTAGQWLDAAEFIPSKESGITRAISNHTRMVRAGMPRTRWKYSQSFMDNAKKILQRNLVDACRGPDDFEIVDEAAFLLQKQYKESHKLSRMPTAQKREWAERLRLLVFLMTDPDPLESLDQITRFFKLPWGTTDLLVGSETPHNKTNLKREKLHPLVEAIGSALPQWSRQTFRELIIDGGDDDEMERDTTKWANLCKVAAAILKTPERRPDDNHDVSLPVQDEYYLSRWYDENTTYPGNRIRQDILNGVAIRSKLVKGRLKGYLFSDVWRLSPGCYIKARR